ncbi:MAG TPA: DUF4010 domain-containing protein [Gammaproteobacteria bacterium]|nr:DUF4010 domain-containing protein [Gammaproteobacteria bacterium]
MDISFPALDLSFLTHAALAVSLSFLIGLEFHNYLRKEEGDLGYGSLRTLTLLGSAGFLFSALDRSNWFFCLGFLVVALWVGLYYQRRLQEGHASLMEPLLALLVYVLGLLAQLAPPWFTASYAVFIIFLLNAKPRIHSFADTVSGQEIATVAKFVIMAGIILPLLPDRQIADFVPITFRQTWFAVVAVSGISYLSYVLQTYVFKTRGVLAAGLLGGLYSSTAATVALSHRARDSSNSLTSPALILATAMMYLRLWVLAAVLAPDSLHRLSPPFAIAMALSIGAAVLLARIAAPVPQATEVVEDQHPLEFQVALLFAILFVVFATATGYVAEHYSGAGLRMLAFAVGFTEIDPFVLSVLSGHFAISLHDAVDVVVIAAASNNLLKAGLAFGLARNRSVLPACGWLALLAAASFVFVLF